METTRPSFEIVTLGGLGAIPKFRLAVSKRLTEYEQWLIHSQCNSPLHEALCALGGPDSFFLDVGANVGSILCACLAKGSLAAGIEPVPSNFIQLVASITANGFDKAYLFNIGASNYDHLGAIVEQGPNSYVVPDGDHQYVVLLKLDTLFDACLDRLSEGKRLIIKVDVEGHEPEVFGGAENILTRRRPIVCFESIVIEGKELPARRMLAVKRSFSQKGYKLFQTVGKAFYETDPDAPQYEHVSDYFAVPAEAADMMKTDLLISMPAPIDSIADAVRRMANESCREHRMHAVGLLGRLSNTLSTHLDFASMVGNLQTDKDTEVAAFARTLLS
jgi:FkbM family methyltransferase